MCTVEQIHCFEKAGLGKAPFTFVGMVAQDICYGERVIGNVGGTLLTTKPGGTCDYCGTYIVNMFRVRSADDKTFKVGCDCIMKCGDAGLIKIVKSEKARMAKERKAQLLNEQINIAFNKLPQVQGYLASKPHPNSWRANKGETMLDYLTWMRVHGSARRCIEIIESAERELQSKGSE